MKFKLVMLNFNGLKSAKELAEQLEQEVGDDFYFIESFPSGEQTQMFLFGKENDEFLKKFGLLNE